MLVAIERAILVASGSSLPAPWNAQQPDRPGPKGQAKPGECEILVALEHCRRIQFVVMSLEQGGNLKVATSLTLEKTLLADRLGLLGWG